MALRTWEGLVHIFQIGKVTVRQRALGQMAYGSQGFLAIGDYGVEHVSTGCWAQGMDQMILANLFQ